MTGFRLPNPLGADGVEILAGQTLQDITSGLDLPGVLGGGGLTPLGASPVVAVEKDWEPPAPDTSPIAAVRGKTLAKVGAELQKLGEWGRGGGSIRGDPNPLAAPGGFKIKLKAALLKQLPVWEDRDGASTAAREEWDRMLAKLEAHEERHLQIAIEEADACAADLVGKDLSQIAARVTFFNGRMALRQAKLDRETESGSKEGVPYGDVILDISVV